MYMLSPKPDSFYHTEQKMALGYQNPFYLKQAQQKQQSLYNGKVLLEKHDPLAVYDSEEILELAHESRLKMKQLNKEIKPAKYSNINHFLGVFVSQTAKSREELYFLNTSKMANVSKSILIPNEEFSDDNTPSVARKFLNEVKSTIVTLQRVVKQKMTLDTPNWSSIAHQEIHKIVKDEIFPIVNQVDARVQNFEIQFLKKAAKFVQNFKSLAKEADESLAKHKALELEIKHLLRAVVSQDIMSIVQSNSVVDTSNLQIKLERTKERFKNYVIKKENEYAKLWNDWYEKCEECKYDKSSYDKAYHNMQQKIKWLQAQLGDHKDKSKDTPCVSNTLYHLPQKLENKNVELEYRIDPTKTSRKDKFVPIYKVRASIRTNPITISQPHVITTKVVNSDSNGFYFTELDITTKTRSQQPRSNTKNDRVIQICLWSVDSGCSKHMTRNLKLLINFVWKFLGTVRFGNDHVAVILGFSDPQWGNILITRVYFVKGLGHSLFSIGKFCDSDLEEIAQQTFTPSIHDMASASSICLMARATSTKSWLWHQRLSHLNFDTINDLSRNDLVTGLPKFKYHKEHLCPSCEQGKSKKASHPPKPVPNYKQRLYLLHMDLCGPMRITSINGKQHVLVIMDDYSHYTWVYFFKSKNEAPEVIKTFLKKIQVLLQALVIIIRTDNGTEFKNQAEAIADACYTKKRSIIHRRFNKTPYEFINDKKPDISFLYVFGALCYPKNDHEDIGKLGAKGDIGFFIGYSTNSYDYRFHNRRTKKIMETIVGSKYGYVLWLVKRDVSKHFMQVMAILVILVSSDSSEDSMGTPAGRVILFGTIPTTIPYTTPVITPPTTQTDTTMIPIETPIITPTIPPSPDYTLASPNCSHASDTESDPSEDPSLAHIPPLPAVLPFLSSDDDTTDSDTPDVPPSPTHGTPFTEITSSTQRSPIIPHRRVMILTPRQPIPHGRPYRYHHNRLVHTMTAKKRVRPLPVQQLVASSYFHSDALSDSSLRHSLSDHSSPDLPSTYAGPSRKRRRDFGYLANVEVSPRETSLRDDVIARGSDEPHLEQDIDPEIQEEIDECFAYADALRDRVINARFVVEAVDRDEIEMGVRGPVEVRVERITHPVMPKDILEPAQEGAVEVIEGVQREQGHRIVGVKSAVTALTERVAELERDNRRLRGTEVEELVARRVAEQMEAREAARNLETLNENGDEQEGENVGNRNGENRGNGKGENGGNRGNGNRGNGENRNHGMNYGGFMPMAQECTFQDFLKCKPYTFSRTEGVVGLTHWFKKIETVFNISNCPPKYQVKYTTCTLQDNALTWWNSHKRTIGVDAAYAMKWAGLMKLMTEELILLCTRMVLDEEDRLERFIGGLPDNIQGNVIATNPARLQDTIRIANQLMDKKLQSYATRSAENKRRMESNPRDNRGQQSPFKRQNTSGQNVARAYTVGRNKRKGCGKCKKIRHQTKDCRVTVTPNTQGAIVGNQQGIGCHECGRPRHFRKDCPKLRSQNRRNQTRNKSGNKTGGNEVTTKAYAIGYGGTNLDSNVVTGTFLLNNFYASMLFDSGVDRYNTPCFWVIDIVNNVTMYLLYFTRLL
nr:retrovirus-related Pol polyprotein from transposon TNT 1-94 [Tanacetum cinerariifolium]